MSEVEELLSRGRGYVRHEMWDAAIADFEAAHDVDPDSVEARVALAEALIGRWEATDFPPDKQRATEHLLAAAQAGSDEAMRLLVRIGAADAFDSPDGLPPVRGNPSEAREGVRDALQARRAPLVLLAVVVMALVSSGVYFALTSNAPPPEARFVEENPPPPLPVDYELATEVVAPPVPETKHVELPVTFDPGPLGENVRFVTRSSKLDVYPERAFYSVGGDFEVTGDVEVDEIEVDLELSSTAGPPAKHHWFAWANHEATLRPGDRGTVSHLVQASGGVQQARLVVTKATVKPASATYPKTREIEPKWSAKAPEGIALQISERSTEFKTNQFVKGGFFRAEWEFHNVGVEPIKLLKYEVRLLDAKNRVLDSQTRLATYSSQPPIEPGEVRLQSAIRQAPVEYHHYGIDVVEIR